MEKREAVNGQREMRRNRMQGMMSMFNRGEAVLRRWAERWEARRVMVSGQEETRPEARATGSSSEPQG